MDMFMKKKMICLGITFVLSLVLTGGVLRGKALAYKIEETQAALAEEVLRFHVIANSNSESDQELKLLVRDTILSYMKRYLSKDADLEMTKKWAKTHLKELEEVAKRVIYTEGFRYNAKAEIKKVSFPGKTYGDITFPAGEYEALRIIIGEGAGENWWCVLYPNLCFLDSIHAVVPKEEKEKLQDVLTKDEYEMVTMNSKFKIKWYFFGCNSSGKCVE